MTAREDDVNLDKWVIKHQYLHRTLFCTLFSQQAHWICGFLRNTRNTESVSLLFVSWRDSYWVSVVMLNVTTQRYCSHTVSLLVFVFIARPAWFVYRCLEKKQCFMTLFEWLSGCCFTYGVCYWVEMYIFDNIHVLYKLTSVLYLC